ncbi:MAG TPA: class I SAM-dependent methyltransferase [Nostocaceae cyanobacterium]|nr:class I SAM-dependent methyltransferase [Nostocaceae cyanobacterium]
MNCLLCPICRQTPASIPSICHTCHNYYLTELEKTPPAILDLTPKSTQTKPLRTELFRFPIISFLYERILPPIWALGLRNSGGIEAEFQKCRDFFGENPGIFADISCGTGIMARKFAKLGTCQQIIALDYSELMLEQLQQQIQLEEISPNQITIIRADIEALPLASDSIDVIYTGAAMHCWPNPENGIRNIYRVLRPGGKLFATTFLKPLPNLIFQFFTVEEIKQIFTTAGFHPSSIQIETKGLYVTVQCVK